MNAPGGNPTSSRAAALQQLDRLDLLVVGGGIVGSGIARDAALRGLRVGLVEQRDFAIGTSSRSSRLLHGGLRYLAQGRVGLVREASHEKRVIHRIAPHLAEPLPFLFPTYRHGPAAQWARWKLSIGVKLYDMLCGGQNLGASQSLSPARLCELLPGIERHRLSGGVRYFDGFTSDARLVLDTLRSAEAAGGLIVNYCRFETATRDGEDWRCTLHDEAGDSKLHIRARCVINAAGPWSPAIPHSQVRLRLTKGVHLVIGRDRLPVPSAVVMTDGSRILFAIPWGQRVILGTTDTDYDGAPEGVTTGADDIEYILGVTNRHFPEARLSETDVISDWAGVRPLIADPNGKPSDISRSHRIDSPEPAWWDVSGGKLTTYRLMAEQTVDRAMHHLGRSVACSTAHTPLLPADETRLPGGILPPTVTRAVVEHACRREWAMHLDDVMIRRTSWHYYHRDRDRIAERVSDWMTGFLGWSEGRRTAELQQYLQRNATPRTSSPASRRVREPAA